MIFNYILSAVNQVHLGMFAEYGAGTMFKMPCYEAKYFNKNYWEEISDIELMDALYKIYNKISPVIKEMIQGKEVQTTEAVYRLKWKGGG